jgi:ArsR family metal-binding transcriptional regulator
MQISSSIIFSVKEAEELRTKLDAAIEKAKDANAAKEVPLVIKPTVPVCKDCGGCGYMGDETCITCRGDGVQS